MDNKTSKYMKTGKELILDLPNGVRRNFILELAKQRGYKGATESLNRRRESLSFVLIYSISWRLSKQGDAYWRNIFNNV